MSKIISVNLKQRMLLHTTYKMFVVSMALMLFSLLMSCAAYGKLSNSGVEDFALKTFGKQWYYCFCLINLFIKNQRIDFNGSPIIC